MVDWQNIEEKRKYHREYQKRKRSTKAGQEYNRSNALNYYRKNICKDLNCQSITNLRNLKPKIFKKSFFNFPNTNFFSILYKK